MKDKRIFTDLFDVTVAIAIFGLLFMPVLLVSLVITRDTWLTIPLAVVLDVLTTLGLMKSTISSDES